MSKICCFAPALLAAGVLLAQNPALPQFEVTSVKPSAPGAPDQVSIGVHADGARISCNYLNVRDYIRIAYKIKDYQIAGPPWLASDRYDIAATLPAGSVQEQVPDMLKGLLADRFKLTLHHETKEFPVYALIVAKTGLKIKESAPDPEADSAKSAVNVSVGGNRNGVSVNLGHGSYFSFAANKLEARRMTMASLAETLARFVDKPVVDMTGLTGLYDIDLNFTEDDYRGMLIRSAVNAGITLPPQALQAMEAASGDSVASAMQAAGMKLDARKAPLDVVVIDHVEKPSAN
ncbi:MAG: TIGR03435 family protein [Terriglobia bacterium]